MTSHRLVFFAFALLDDTAMDVTKIEAVMTRTIKLTTTQMKMVGCEQDVDKGVGEGKSILVPGVVWQRVIALAETRSFHAPRGDFLPGQAGSFAKALREGIAAGKVLVGPRRLSGQTALDQLTAYFRVPAHKQALQAVLRLVSEGGGLEVTEA